MTWSYTRWSDYATCPALYRFKYLDKYPIPKNKAMENAPRFDVPMLTEGKSGPSWGEIT